MGLWYRHTTGESGGCEASQKTHRQPPQVLNSPLLSRRMCVEYVLACRLPRSQEWAHTRSGCIDETFVTLLRVVFCAVHLLALLLWNIGAAQGSACRRTPSRLVRSGERKLSSSWSQATRKDCSPSDVLFTDTRHDAARVFIDLCCTCWNVGWPTICERLLLAVLGIVSRTASKVNVRCAGHPTSCLRDSQQDTHHGLNTVFHRIIHPKQHPSVPASLCHP